MAFNSMTGKGGGLTVQDKQLLGRFASIQRNSHNILQNAAGRPDGLFTADDMKEYGQHNFSPKNVPTIQDFLATPSAQVLIPKVILGAMREIQEPLYVAMRYLDKVMLRGAGQSMVFPAIGTIARAYDVGEGQEIPEDTMDWEVLEKNEIRVGKVGLRLRVTDEMVSDSQWDIISLMVKAAGRAMIRHKEQKAFNAFSQHQHPVFDNLLADPEAHTTGRDAQGNYNNTLAVEDLLNMIIAIMANENTPTDILLHPLSWLAFARSELTGALSINNQMHGIYGAQKQPDANFQLGPNSIQGRLPFAFNVVLSPFVPIDKVNKTYDFFVVDKDNVGVCLVKEELKIERFDEPARDISNIKFVERYGIGIHNEGRGIAVAKNISLEKSYPEIPWIHTIS